MTLPSVPTSALSAWRPCRGAADLARAEALARHYRRTTWTALEILCLAVSLFLCGYFAWYSIDMTWASYQLSDVSQGLVAVPLWVPQSGMALGLVVLAIALADDLLVSLLGGTTSYEAADAKRAGAMPSFER